jgi:hypothetical protein
MVKSRTTRYENVTEAEPSVNEAFTLRQISKFVLFKAFNLAISTCITKECEGL